MKKLRVFEMFAGYGGASFALKKAGIPFECVGFSEVDKYAIQCYEQNHCEFYGDPFNAEEFHPRNYGDCSKINPNDLPDFDLLTGGFPCQDVSIAGNRDLSKGRTMLVNDIFRIAAIKKPKYLFLENVKGLISTEPLWTNIKWTIQKLGYDLRYKVLNSKEHGIPQNRERIWIIGSREGFEPFKEIFPHKEKLKILLKDILEREVDEKYYLTKKNKDALINGLKKRGKNLKSVCREKEVNCLTARNPTRALHDTTIIPVITPDRINKRQKGRRFKTDGEPMFTLNTQDRHGILINDYKIRRLTPKECFRLMGFLKDEINLDELSDTQKYKLAGNGWDINVVSKIFKNIFNEHKGEK